VAAVLFPKPRTKTYAAQSGYVYQYIFEGLENSKYRFRAVAGPQIEMLLEVVLDSGILAEWVEQNRALNEIETFGLAKMALMRTLDQLPQPENGLIQIAPEAEDIDSICRELDFVE
jgi:hypothetical protein